MSDEPASKRAKVDESGDTYSESVKKALKEIEDVQGEIDNINEKASDEILKIEQKYNGMRRPFFDKRAKVVKDIPNFWLTALINHPQISSVVDEQQEAILANLLSVEVEEFEDLKSGFRIVFKFKENEYFENDTVAKEYFLGSDEPSSKSTPIKWKPGKEIAKKDENEEDGSFLGLTFFEWLGADIDPANDDIAEVIKDDIWPNPLQYFLVPEVEDLDDDDLEEVDDEGGSDVEDA